MEAALAEAEMRSARYLALIEPYWPRAWNRVLRGERPQRPPPPHVPRPRRIDPRSAWEVLGLSAGASLAEVKAAFRALALASHPDHGGNAGAFRELYQAYERLLVRIAR
jgi:hypothetical protein